MGTIKPMLAAGAVAAALTPSATLAATTTGTTTPSKTPTASERALLHSHELWATIDVCSPADQENTVGIRGSMPGDGKAHDRMYMSFRLQYLSSTGQWVNLVKGATPSFVAVGTGASARQGGASFQLQPVAGKPASTLRGVVDFEWRRGKTVLVSSALATSAGHKSLAGADPANFSAASCVIG